MEIKECLRYVEDNIKILYENYDTENKVVIEHSLKEMISHQPSTKAVIFLKELFYGSNSALLEKLKIIWKNGSNDVTHDILEVQKDILMVLENRRKDTLQFLSHTLKCIQEFLSGNEHTSINVIHFIIKILMMEKLPTQEDGWFREFSRNVIVDDNGQLKTVTEIFYLLEKNKVSEQVSCWHALYSGADDRNVDETFTWYGGNPLSIFQLEEENHEIEIRQTVINKNSRLHTLKSGTLFGAEMECTSSRDVFSLVTCKCISAFLYDRYKDPKKDMPEKWNALVELYIKNAENENKFIANTIKKLIPTSDLDEFEKQIETKRKINTLHGDK